MIRSTFLILFFFSFVSLPPFSLAEKRDAAGLNQFFPNKGTLILRSKAKIPVYLALTRTQKQKGLSGIKPEEFSNQEGMLFYYADSQKRYFWMPDTYFDLDIFFLDKKFQVIEIERNVPHHPGIETPPPIPKTKVVHCRYVLEIRSSAKAAKAIQVGDRLKLKTKLSKKELKRQAKRGYWTEKK